MFFRATSIVPNGPSIPFNIEEFALDFAVQLGLADLVGALQPTKELRLEAQQIPVQQG